MARVGQRPSIQVSFFYLLEEVKDLIETHNSRPQAVPQDGHGSKEIERSKRKKKRPFRSLQLDSTDWTGTARSIT